MCIISIFRGKKSVKDKLSSADSIKKFYEIREAIIQFYHDKDCTLGVIDIPAFIRADKVINEVIKSEDDIEFYWNKLQDYKNNIA